MHVIIGSSFLVFVCSLSLSVLQHLQYLRLEETKAKVVIGDSLVAGSCKMLWLDREARFGNMDVV